MIYHFDLGNKKHDAASIWEGMGSIYEERIHCHGAVRRVLAGESV